MTRGRISRASRSERPQPVLASGLLVVVLAIGVAGCREHHWFGLDNQTGAVLNDPEKRHAIGFGQQTEQLVVEMGGKGDGLSRNQRADVHAFLREYKGGSAGPLTIAAPGSAAGHLVVSRSIRDVFDMAREAGIPEGAVRVVRLSEHESGEYGPAIRLAYGGIVAVPPQCGNWPDNLARNRELLPFENFGCASQANLALTVANARDLRHPQEETPRSSERRSVTWSKYVTGGPDSGDAAAPAGAPAAPAGGAPPPAP
ncbi:MAG: CpaD family pilus assembly protein [Hyphomicrobiaceae bacterium]|nr:CpaD family pilus assembly protein [Hyphomicrobiaceae bacterium]